MFFGSKRRKVGLAARARAFSCRRNRRRSSGLAVGARRIIQATGAKPSRSSMAAACSTHSRAAASLQTGSPRFARSTDRTHKPHRTASGRRGNGESGRATIRQALEGSPFANACTQVSFRFVCGIHSWSMPASCREGSGCRVAKGRARTDRRAARRRMIDHP